LKLIRIGAGLCLLGLSLVLAACRSRTVPARVIVLGIDGLDPQVTDLLMSFAKLRQEGAYAPLESEKPLLSPVIWTTIATGKRKGAGVSTSAACPISK
jgi:hypothetical protein